MDPKLSLKLVVLGAGRLGNPCLVLGVIQLKQYVTLWCLRFKFFRIKNLLAQTNAPSTPIGAREIHEQILFLRCRLRLCLFEINEPAI